jgi:hypothetical protein
MKLVENNSDFYQYILNDVVAKTFKSLLKEEQIFLAALMTNIINTISIKFSFQYKDKNIYIHQFKQNENRDLRAILNMLLPFITNDDKDIKKNQLKKLSDLYKVDLDMNKKPINLITNIQYNRSQRQPIISNEDNIPIEYSNTHIINNYYLLLDTIQSVANKLYINWNNVLPVTINNYEKNNLYINTIKNLNVFNENRLNNDIDNRGADYIMGNVRWWLPQMQDEIGMKYNGLYVGDIYHTITIEFYEKIKKIKWLIYDVLYNDIPIPSIIVLATLFPSINKFINNGITWDSLNEEDQKNFIIDYGSFINSVKDGGNLLTYNNIIIDNNIISKIFKYFYYFFQKYYSGKNDLIDNKLLLPIKEEDLGSGNDSDEEEEDDKEYVLVDTALHLVMLKSIDKVPISHIYTFMFEQIDKLKKTWFYHKLTYFDRGSIEDNNNKLFYILQNDKTYFKKRIYLSYKLNKNGHEYFLTLKNLYNFSKSFCHYEIKKSDNPKQNEWAQFDTHWNTLIPEHKKIILHRINFDPTRFIKSNDRTKNILMNIYNDVIVQDHNTDNYFLPWFNISKSLTNLYPYYKNIENITSRNDKLTKHMYWIYRKLRDNGKIISFIFESLIYKGMLMEFRPNKDLTDESLLPKSDNKKFDEIKKILKETILNDKNKDKYKKYAYYFLNYNTYGNLENIYQVNEFNNKKNKEKGVEYFDLLLDRPDWPFFYAMDWISQINFYHHYINNRVMFVTGSTGVGKSTQVPKLLLYALRMVDYNDAGKIVCSQPRTAPTENNAEEISRQMGVPVKKYNTIYNDQIPTNNYYIQYKHSKSSHVSKNQDYFLKIVTDGTLFNEILSSPLLKRIDQRKTDEYNELNKNNNKTMYTDENIYDIVIVDESHEHNTNMDLILTLSRYAAYYNNSVKIIIVSATIDDDEPIYRRYYRDINDNRMYPLNSNLYNSYWYADEIIQIDRINVDRRMHISPPGQTTKYKITDYFLSDEDSKEVTSENYFRKAVDKTVQVSEMNPEGDILLFLTGSEEIRKACAEINKRTVPTTICLPFYSELSTEQENLVKNIHKNISLITKMKEDVLLDEHEIAKDRRVAPGTYKRAIIVATNIAEASITISTLRFVIDIGRAKTNVYNYYTDNNQLEMKFISNSSSLQRKGRVGRVASGTVYYLYAENDLKKNISSYKIVDDNFCETFYALLRKKHNEELLFDPKLDPNLISYYNDNENLFGYEGGKFTTFDYFDDINQQFANHFSIQKNPNDIEHIIPLLKKQYYVTHHIKFSNMFFSYYGNLNHYDYFYAEPPPEFYQTGYNYNTLVDKECKFYLIHPDESLYVKQPFSGTPINLKNETYNNKELGQYIKEYVNYKYGIKLDAYNDKIVIPSPKFNIMKNILKSKLFIVSQISEDNKKELVKTDYGYHFKKFASNYSPFTSDISTSFFALSHIYNCNYEVLPLLVLFEATLNDSQMFNYYKNKLGESKVNQQEKFKNLFSDENSDIISLFNLANNIVKYFAKYIDKIKFDPNDIKEINNYKYMKKIYLNNKNKIYNNNNVNINKEILTYGDFILFHNFETGRWKEDYYMYIKNSRNNIKNKFIMKIKSDYVQKIIENWCKYNNMDHDFVRVFITYYYFALLEIDLLHWENNYINSKKESKNELNLSIDELPAGESLEWLIRNIRPSWINDNNIDINKKLIIMLIKEYGDKLLYNVDNDNYISLNQNVNINISSISKLPFKEIPDSTIKYFSKYVLYYDKSFVTKDINLITNVELRWILELVPYKLDKNKIIKKLNYVINNYSPEKYKNISIDHFKKIIVDISDKFTNKYLIKQAQLADKTISDYLLSRAQKY